MTHEELSYIAGFFDGEGCCGIKQLKRPKSILHSPYITVSQVRPAVLHWMAANFGGSVKWKKSPADRGDGIWVWQLSCRKACVFLQAIIPFLRIKKAEAELVVQVYDLKTKHKNKGVPPEVVEFRETLRQKVMALR